MDGTTTNVVEFSLQIFRNKTFWPAYAGRQNNGKPYFFEMLTYRILKKESTGFQTQNRSKI